MKKLHPQESMDFLRYSIARSGGQASKTIYHEGNGPFILGLEYRETEMLFCVYEFITVDELIKRPFKIPSFINQRQFIYKMLDTMGLDRNLYRKYRNDKKYPLYRRLTPENKSSQNKLKYFFTEYWTFVGCSLLIDPTGTIRKAKPQDSSVVFQ
jgi:hypothetical protein